MRRRRVIATAAGLTLMMGAGVVLFQNETRGTEWPALDPGPGTLVERVQRCESCRIELEEVAELGVEDEALMALGARAYPGAHHLYALDLIIGHEIRVFDGSGAFLGRIGREGEGPGEFIQITAVVEGPGDTLHVFDERNVRWSVLSPRTFELVRNIRLPVRPTFETPVVLGDGSLVVNAVTGDPLVHVGPDGTRLGSFGQGAVGVDRPRSSPSSIRRTALSQGATIWVALPEVYRIERWSADGDRIEAFVSHPRWMSSERQVAEEGRVRAPVPTILDVAEDREGLLWVSLRIADPDWEEGVEDGRIRDLRRYVDGIVDIIDPRTGELVHSERFETVMRVRGRGIATTSSEGEFGERNVSVYRVRLLR